jgi:hypothetical protein
LNFELRLVLTDLISTTPVLAHIFFKKGLLPGTH